MKPPPLILGAALMFWGWRTDLLAVGAIVGGLLELSNGIKGRWDFSDKEFNRLWDVCTALFLLLAAYLRLAEEVTNAAYKFFQWMPLVFYPMAVGSMFSLREGVPIKAFSWFLRRKGSEGGDRPIPFGWVYFVVCLITAGATNDRDIWFYICFALLSGWALWTIQPRRISGVSWVSIFLIVAVAGFLAQVRMQDLQTYLEGKASELLVKFGRKDFDPNQSKTAMGRIGSLKQSGRIVLKVKSEIGPLPERLRQSTYVRLDETTWRGNQRNFEAVTVEPDITTWTILTNSEPAAAVRIVERVNRLSSLLSVPLGMIQFRDLAVGKVETNQYLVVRTSDNPGLLDYSAHYGNTFADRPPGEWDRSIPDVERNAVESVAAELNIEGLSDTEKVQAIIQFFQDKFRYTTYQAARALGLHAMTPLSEFLLKTRAGHCEYFATATVLLLRHYQIPARYSTGYAVQQTSKEDDFYLVRERDGHAWALAYVGDQWIEVDSTPAGWMAAERQEFPAYQGLKDWWERFTFGFLEWRWLGDWGVVRMAAPWLAAPLIGFLGWRVFGRRMFRRPSRLRDLETWPGNDSEFFQLEKQLSRAGLGRNNHEITSDWLRRVAEDTPAIAESLRKIVRLHFKYRFDPDGIQAEERAELRELVRLCMANL